MKKILRNFVIDTYCLYLTANIASGMLFTEGVKTFILTGAALTVGSVVAKPVINLLLLPLNMVTFGLFRWVSSAVILYLITLTVKSFTITGFYFSGYSSKWIDIPAINLQGVLAFIAFSFILSIFMSFLSWLLK